MDQANYSDISVLIVDDNDMTRETLRVVLHHVGYQIVGEAGDGDVAFDQAMRLQPDLILLDVVMPRVSGLEALKNIRAEMKNVAILMVSANQDEETVSVATHLGISGYIAKPFKAREVLTTLAEVAQVIRDRRASLQ